jgi:hypothetical protein
MGVGGSDRFMGEIQLAEIVDGDLWGVVRTWDESGEPAFEAFRFDGSKVVERLAIQPAEYALSATLGQFEAGPDGLYQMRSTARDFSIVRYEFGG